MRMTHSDLPPALSPREVANALRASLLAVRVECTGLSAAVLRWHPAPGEWCVLEVIGHLIEAEERGFAGRVRTLLSETDPQFRAWDQNAVARERRDCEKDSAGLLTEWTRLRETGIAAVEGLRSDELVRAGHHPTVGRLSIADLPAPDPRQRPGVRLAAHGQRPALLAARLVTSHGEPTGHD
jgi:hypothetical protein